MSQANVTLGNIANTVWYTDKAEIVTGNTVASYNVYEVNVAQPVTLAGYIVNGSPTLTTTYTGANIIGRSITGTGIAANSTISTQTKNSDSVTTSFTLSANATANTGNASTYANFTATAPAPGNIYSAAPQVAASSRQQIYVGAGNFLTVTSTGNTTTTRELGTASSATAAG
jgi:hypothetical protein